MRKQPKTIEGLVEGLVDITTKLDDRLDAIEGQPDRKLKADLTINANSPKPEPPQAHLSVRIRIGADIEIEMSGDGVGAQVVDRFIGSVESIGGGRILEALTRRNDKAQT